MKKIKSFLALLMALIIFAAPVSYSAAEPKIPTVNYTVLGDSIASGYGLKSIHSCYASTISAQKMYHLANNAVPGHTTENLLWVICHSEIAREDIKNAQFQSAEMMLSGFCRMQTPPHCWTLC